MTHCRPRSLLLPFLAIGIAVLPRCAAQMPNPAGDLATTIRTTWDFSNPARSERLFRDRAARAADPEKAELETQVARALGLQGRFDVAIRLLDAIDERATDMPERVRVRIGLERGRCLSSSGDPTRARPLFVEAWERARAARLDDLAIDAAHMVAITESGSAALDWNLRALALADASTSGDARRWRTSLFNNIAWTYHDTGDYDQALRYFQKALEEARRGGDRRVRRVAEWSVGRALRSLGRYREAFEVQTGLESELTASHEVDGYVLEEIAENLLALGRARDAAPYFRRAHAVLAGDDALRRGEPARLERLQRLGGDPEATAR